jgi:hypothetical protein
VSSQIHYSTVCVLVQIYFRYEFSRKCRSIFRCQFPGERFPCKRSTHNIVNKLKTTGSMLDRKPDRKRNLLTEEKLDDIGTRLETSPRRSLIRLAQETCVSEKSASRATKLLKVRPCKTKNVYTQGSLKYEAYKKILTFWKNQETTNTARF